MDESIVADNNSSVVVRHINASDLACIYSTWRKSAYFSQPDRARGTKASAERATFFRDLNFRIKGILDRAVVRVAVLQDSPSTILGYSVSTGTHLVWVYVKPEFRRVGLARMLAPPELSSVSATLTPIGQSIVKSHNLQTKED